MTEENIKYKISDLYKMNFQSDMTENEYMRERLLNLDIPISEDVYEEQKKIENTDCIIFLYPVWWSDCPAKLKGWFDRVYSVGYAYGHSNKGNKMKTIKYGISLCTAGHSNTFLDKIGIAESMRNVMIDDRLGKRFYKKCIIKNDWLVGAILMGDKSEFADFKRLIEEKIELSERREELLRSSQPDKPVIGKLICSCSQVGEGNIEEAIKEGCEDFSELCTKTGAGLGCGSCKPEVKEVLNNVLQLA